jgi:hypothetical protein
VANLADVVAVTFWLGEIGAMRRRELLARGGIVALLLASLLTTAQSSQADEWYPGLPDATFGTWANGSQGGLSYARRAKQWFRSPTGMTAVEYKVASEGDLSTLVRGDAYVVSPKGAPANYGYLEPMTVRSVGFGLMPVEATVQVSQRRAGGYPVPVRAALRTHSYSTTGSSHPDRVAFPSIVVDDSFNVQILSVRVDGVDLGLDGDCRTATPAPVHMRTPAFDKPNDIEAEWYRGRDPSTYYHPYYGGQLTGTITIPPFTGCTTKAGDDLSRLLTLSVSGPDNPIQARTGWPCEFYVGSAPAPAPPGASTPKLGGKAGGRATGWSDSCPGPKPFTYPARD